MDPQTYDAMMELLHQINEKADGMIHRQDCTNGRVTSAEKSITRLWMAVFGGGSGLVAVVWYLVQLHIK